MPGCIGSSTSRTFAAVNQRRRRWTEVQRFPGGVAAFHAVVWQPLYAQLEALRAAGGARRQLILIVGDYGGAVPSGSKLVRPCNELDSAPPDARLTDLPRLAPFKPADVRRWLEDLELPAVPAGRHDRLVRAALTNPVSGKDDGTPARVFARLWDEQLWSDEEA